MTLAPDKLEWIQNFSKSAKLQGALEERRQMKDAILSKVAADILEIGGELFANMNLRVSDGDKEQQVLNYGLRDQTTEFDLDEQQDGFTLMSEEDIGKHLEANRTVTELTKQLDVMVDELDENGVATGAKVRLFSKEEIADEVYEPLVRQGLLAETFVPDEFSKTKKTIDGAFGSYKERLKAEGVNNKIFNKENFSFGMNMLGAGTQFLGSAGGFIGANNVNPKELGLDQLGPSLDVFKKIAKKDTGEILTLAAQSWEFVSAGKEGVGDIVERVNEKGEKIPPNRQDKAPKVAEFIASAVAASLTEGFKNYGLGTGLSYAYSSSVKTKSIGLALSADELNDESINKVTGFLKAGFGEALKECDTKPATPAVTTAGLTMATKFESTMSSQTAALIEALNKEDYTKVIKAYATAGEAAVAEAMKDGAFRSHLNSKKGEMSEKLDKKMGDDFLKEAQEDDQAAQRELVAIENEKDVRKKAGLLEKKIKSMQRSQALVKWASTVAGMGFTVASKFIAPLAIAGSALKLALNVANAAKRMRDFIVFVQQQRDMFNAASEFSAPVANFIHNSEIQALHYQINAACEFVNMVGAIVETAGTASGMGAAAAVVVGKTMQATASAIAASEAVLYEIKKRYDVEQGWKMYKAALIRPENRKMALIAMKKNPTLAKYSMAWGAVIKGDPLVKDFMDKCGLNAETLKDEKTNVDLVVKYLEVRMPDDSVLVGREVSATDWEPSPLVLTVQCWTGTKRRGEDKAALEPQDTRDIDLALTAYEAANKILAANYDPKQQPTPKLPTDAMVEAVVDALNKVEAAFLGYRPRRIVSGEKTVRHQQMVDLMETYAKLVTDRRTEVEKIPTA